MQLTANVYVETEFRGCTVSFVTTENGIVMIDSPYKPSEAIKWRNEMQLKGSLKYIINTEYHQDHTAGNFFFDAPIIVQDKTAQDMMKLDPNQIARSFTDMNPEHSSLFKEYRLRRPTITFLDRLSLTLGQHDFHLFHLPGHTLGQTIVYVPKEKVVFTGDNVIGKVQSYLQHAEPFLWLESLKQIESLDVDYIVTGHGEVCTKSGIKEQADYIQDCIKTVKNAIDEGLPKEDILTKVTLPARFPIEKGNERNNDKYIQMSVSRLYDVLSARNSV